MTPIKLWFVCAYLWLQVFQPQPPRDNGKTCGGCNTWNESFRTTCIGCGASI